MSHRFLSPRKLRRAAYAHLCLAMIIVSVMLFLSAGTIHYWEAWVYLALMLISSSLITQYLLRYSPALLERRMRMHEKEVAAAMDHPARLAVVRSHLSGFRLRSAL